MRDMSRCANVDILGLVVTQALTARNPIQDEAESGAASDAGFRLPLYVDAWVEELLSRMFAILSNLENPNQGDDSARLSFLLEGNSMFRCAPTGMS